MSATHGYCVKCGHALPQAAAFCPACGTQVPLPVAVQSSPTHADNAATMAPGAAGSGQTFSATSVMTSAGAKPKFGEAQFFAGDQIGPRYTVIKLLGAGGMGAVYHAFDQELGVGVAVKVIRPALQADATAARDLEQRFKRELLLARQITHKHVVRIHDIGDIDGIKYLTMPFIDGETLADVIRREGTLQVPRATAVVSQVAAGLEAAHAKGVVHRDLKPENIMIEKDTGDALIMDFGIARSVESGSTQTAAGSVIGTLEYMPPEQAQGKKVDGRADIYALGLILYDCLTGRQRVAKAENPMKEMMSRLGTAPAPPRSLNNDVPEALDRIVSKCLEPSAENRFQTTQELVAALAALTADDSSRAEASPKPATPVPAASLDPDATYLGGPVRSSAPDPDATYLGRPVKPSGSDPDVTFAGGPGAAPGRLDDAATIAPTSAGSGGTHTHTHTQHTHAHKGIIEVGHQFGTRYHIIRELGVGGMGAVYQAWDAELGVAVAVKVIRPEIASNPDASADIERRFKRELLLARQITHPNVVRIHDLGDIDGIKYITMPFIEGSDLASILEEHKQLPVQRALHIARGVVAGLVSAHEAGVVHRDLKPANIMIGADDVPTIMDFGIARSADGPQQPAVTPRGVRPNDLSRTAGLSASTTQVGAVVGTVAYMAPEQASGKPVDQRADIYALGLILYDMLIGGRRREGAQSAIAELMGRMQTAPAAPRTIDETIPVAVDAIVRRCLEPDPEKRFQKTVDLHAAFERLDENGKPLPIIRRLTRRGVGASAAAVLLLLAGTFFAAQWLFTPPVVRDPISVLVADFNNQTGDAVFDNAVEQALTMGIEGASFIRAYPRGSAQDVARLLKLPGGARIDENAALLVAKREDIKLILAGSISAAGSGYSLNVRAVNPTAEAGESEVASASAEAGNKDEVLAAVASLAAELRRDLGDTDEEIAKTAAADSFTTNSMEAMQAYGVAQQLQASGRRAESLEEFIRAIKYDPQFGLAYSGAAVASNALGRTPEAQQYWKTMLTHLDRMNEREKYRALGAYYLGAVRNFAQAIDTYKLLVTKYPADRYGRSNLALSYFWSLDMQRAREEAKQAVDLDPKNLIIRINYALYAMYAGEFDLAAAEAKTVLDEQRTYHLPYLPLAMAAIVKPDLAAARAAYGDMAKSGARGASLAPLGLADVALYEGHAKDAVTLLEAALAADEKAGITAGVANKSVLLAEAYERLGQKARAVAAANQAIKASNGQVEARVPAASVLLRLGQDKAARTIAGELSQQLQAQDRAYGKILEGRIALKERRFADAVEAFNAAKKLADLWAARFDLGVAFIEAGHYAEGLAELDECKKRRGEATAIFLNEVPSYRYMATLPYWLGRAQQELGMRDAALGNYKEFLDLRGSSPDDPLVPDARTRASK